ncbi:ribonuclease Y [Candidatus Woesebacteria bacterium]|nr:ribonuclease Y [Candidatus Woesebacteria bacterium]
MSFFGNLSTLFGNQTNTNQQNKNNQKKVVKKQNQPHQPQNQVAKNTNQQAQKASAELSEQEKRAHAETLEQINREAMAKAREIVVEAKAEALTIRSKAENESRELAKAAEQAQRNLEKQLDRVEVKLDWISKREESLTEQRDSIQKLKLEIEDQKANVIKKLEEASKLTTEEAKSILFERLETKLSTEMAQFIRQKEEEAQTDADDKVKEILVDAMKHGATDYVSEYTVSVVQLPSEDTKGKIIGKSGRNINSFERRTGVDVDLDMSPTEVRLSCFDPVRREIARISLEKLIKDGRIQPTRIEEVVDKVEKDIAKITLEAGKQLCHDIGIYNLPIELMRMIGKFKYRFSYGQNLIAHTLEETKIGIKIAHELKLDVRVVKLGCLLHDIGKVSDEVEGSHVELGIKIAKKFGITQDVIDCIAQHHEDEPFSGPEQMAVYIADAISGARPGARYENHDEYVQRLQKLEEIAMNYKEVKQAYAIQAGREIRVLLEPEKSKDSDVKVLSMKIRDEIKASVTYPGTVTVTVIRELRGQEVAK